MNGETAPQPRRSALPSWLSGQTIALLGGMIALGAFCQTGFTGLRQDFNGLRGELKGEIHGLRKELKGDISSLRTELKGDMDHLRVELKGDIAELRTDLRRLEDRTRAVEVAVVGINVRLDNLERPAGAHEGLSMRGGVAQASRSPSRTPAEGSSMRGGVAQASRGPSRTSAEGSEKDS